MITTRVSRQGRKVAALVAAAGLLSGVCALAPADASAARHVTACWGANGYAIGGLTTTIVYWRNGGWRYYGAPAATHSNGCVAYRIRGRWLRRQNIRVYATGYVPNWRSTVSSMSYYWAPAGRSRYFLGTAELRISSIPADSFAVNTSSWLDAMDGTSSGTCSSSTAAMVACYMDRHGLHGNVVVPLYDSDGDGYLDGYDSYPNDPHYY